MNKPLKYILISLAGLILLLAGFSISPYSESLRKQYSSIFETSADNLWENSEQKAMNRYIVAKYLYPSESLRFKVGSVYLSHSNDNAAEREFDGIQDAKIKSNIAEKYLKLGSVDKASRYLVMNSAVDDMLYIEQVIHISTKDTIKTGVKCTEKDSRCSLLVSKMQAKNLNNSVIYNKVALADILNNEGFPKVALQKIESVEDNNYRDLYNIKGVIYYNNELYDKSAVALNKSIELDPFDIETYRLLASVYDTLKDKENSELAKSKMKSLSTEYIKY